MLVSCLQQNDPVVCVCVCIFFFRLFSFIFVVQSLNRVWLFVTPWTEAHQASPVLHHLSEFAQAHVHWVSDVIHPSISSSVTPFSSCPQSFPASGTFPMSWKFTSGGQSIGASASVLPVNIQGWLPLGLTGLISLKSQGSQESYPASQFERINALALSLFDCPTLTSVHDYWKKHSID